MADVQLEDGHVRIANSLWEAWNRADTTAAELRVLMAVVRLSYGWGRKATAPQYAQAGPPPASTTQIQRMTGLDPKSVRRGLRGLVVKQIVRRVRAGDARTNLPAIYAPEKDFDLWSPGVLPGTWEPEDSPPQPGGTLPVGPGGILPVGPGGILPVGPGGILPPHKNKGEQEEQEPPPTPPGGRAPGSLKVESPKRARAGKVETPEAARVFARWLELQTSLGIRRSMKAFPASWGVQARIEEHGEAAVLGVIEWAHQSGDDRAARLREGAYLGQTLFRPRNFPDYDAAAQRFCGTQGHSDTADDYEIPSREDYVEFRGGYVMRSPSGVWRPRWKQLMAAKLPWRALMLEVAERVFRSPDYDKHEPTPYREALRSCPFPAEPYDAEMQAGIDAALLEVRDDA